MYKLRKRNTHLVPGVFKLRPLRIRDVSFPATTAKGEMDINCGELHVFKDLNKYTFPDIAYNTSLISQMGQILKFC